MVKNLLTMKSTKPTKKEVQVVNSPAKILVVDDTPKNVKLLADVLSVKGYAVVTAGSG